MSRTKNVMFMYDKKIQIFFITLSKKYPNFLGFKFKASVHLSLEAEQIIVHRIMEPTDIVLQTDFDRLAFKQRELRKLQMKAWTNKSEKVKDNLPYLYLYLWNQCILPSGII